MKPLRPYQFAATGLIVAAYIGLRIWHLTDSCLWFDEIFSVHAAEHSWDAILSFVAADLIHPPLFYLILKVWIGIGGEGLFWLRMLPVVASIIAIFPFVMLFRELKLGRKAEAISLLFLTVNGSLLKYSQELRMYSLLMCFSLFSMWLFARYFVKGKSYAPLVIANVLLVYTHYFGWFVVVSEVALILYIQRIKCRRALEMLGIVTASFLPWLIAVLNAAGSSGGLAQNIGWMSRPGLIEIVTFLLNLGEPFYYRASSVEAYSVYRVALPILIIIGAAKILFFTSWKERTAAEKRNIKFLYVLTAVPIIAALILSWLLPYSIWGTRHLILVFPLVAIFIGIFLDSLKERSVQAAAFTMLILFTGYAFVIDAQRPLREFSWCAWEPLVNTALTSQPGNVYTVEDLVAYHTWFAERKDAKLRVFKLSGIAGVVEDKAYFLPRSFGGVITEYTSEIADKRFWLLYRTHDHEEYGPAVSSLLEQNYVIKDRKTMKVGGEDEIAILFEK